MAGSANEIEVGGQVVNNSTTSVDDVRIGLQFYDSDGQLLHETYRFITQPFQLLQPGETILFSVPQALDYAQINNYDIDNYDIVAQAERVTSNYILR